MNHFDSLWTKVEVTVSSESKNVQNVGKRALSKGELDNN
jgi:hypothetical protein